MNLLRSIIKLGSANILGSAISFLTIIFLSRILTPGELGQYFLFHAILGVVVVFSDIGLRNAVEKRISAKENKSEYATATLFLRILLFMPAIFFIYVFRNPINSYIGEDLWLVLIVGIIAKALSGIGISILRGELKVELTASIELSRYIIWALATITIILFVEESSRSPAIALVLSYIFVNFAVLLTTDSVITIPGLSTYNSILNFSAYSYIPSLGHYAHGWTDVIILGAFVSQAAVGVYEIAWQVSEVTIVIGSAIAYTIYPQFSQWNTEGKTKKIEQVSQDVIILSLLLVIPAFFGSLVLSEDLLGIIFGSEYTTASLALIILMGGKIIRTMRQIYDRILLGMDQPQLTTKATLLDISLNVFLNLVLIYFYGIIGAAIGTTVSMTVGTIARYYYVSQFVNINIPTRAVAWITICSLTMTILLTIMTSIYVINTFSSLMLIILFGTLFYFVILLSDEKMRSLLRNGTNRLNMGE